jgi:hypothetical protein
MELVLKVDDQEVLGVVHQFESPDDEMELGMVIEMAFQLVDRLGQELEEDEK